jgi:hypothetical protein
LSNLTSLDLTYCDHVTDLSPLIGFANLRELRLSPLAKVPPELQKLVNW